MCKVGILANSVEAAKWLHEVSSRQAFDVDVESGKYKVDAKSILGIFSLDLSKEVSLKIHSVDKAEVEDYIETLREKCIVVTKDIVVE